jgi:hypothetical protein
LELYELSRVQYSSCSGHLVESAADFFGRGKNKKPATMPALVHLNPAENEMEALADAVIRYFTNEEALSIYS